MNDLVSLQELFRHMEWADSLIWTAVFASPEASSDTALRDRLHHTHLVQRAFLRVWRGDYSGPQASSFTDSRSLLHWAREYYAELTRYMSRLNGKGLGRPLAVPWAQMIESRLGRKAEAPSLGETLLQVTMHSAYHRGQVSTRLRELGGEPPLTDFIVWVWLGKPQPAWPAAEA